MLPATEACVNLRSRSQLNDFSGAKMRSTLAMLWAVFGTVFFTNISVAADCDGLLIAGPSIYASPHCLPERPKRVVVLDPSFSLGIGLDVGLPIVGAPLARMGDQALHDRAIAAGITSLGFITEPSLERLVGLQPDLIIGFTGNIGLAESYYPIFAQIAPTILETSAKWKPYYRLLAHISGQEKTVDALFEKFDARIKDLRIRIPNEQKVSVLRITSWDFQVYPSGPDSYAPFALLSEVGVKRSDYENGSPTSGVLRPDWEELAKLDGDILLYIVGGTNDSDTDGRHEDVLNHPLWKMLPAVQAGRVHRINPGTWMEFNGLGSANRVLDDIETYIIND